MVIIFVPVTDYLRHTICKAELNASLSHIAKNNPFVSYNRSKPLAEPCHAKTGLNTIGNVVHTAIQF